MSARTLSPVLFGFVLTVLVVLSSETVAAQTDNRLAVGGSVTSRIAGSSVTDASAHIGFELRLGHEREEWGWAYSFFGWYDMELEASPAMPPSTLGRLRVRPVMLGYGYTWIRGPASITVDMLGGFSFNSFHLDPATIAAYEHRGATGIDGEATNTFVIKPEVQVWYDLSPRYGLKISGGYLISRPSVSITSTLGRDTRALKADTILITVGFVYSII
jgi:hypothetical protein